MTISARNFPLLQIILCIPSYSVASSFKEYDNPEIKINKMVNEQCVTYRPSHGYFFSNLYRLLSVLLLLSVLVFCLEFLAKPVYSTMA